MTAVMKDAFVFNQGNNCRIKPRDSHRPSQWREIYHLTAPIFTTVSVRLVQLTDDTRVLMAFLLKLATQVCRSRLVTDTPTWALCNPELRQLPRETTQPTQISRPVEVCMIAHNTFSFSA